MSSGGPNTAGGERYDGRLVNKKIGKVRTRGDKDGLTRAEAERGRGVAAGYQMFKGRAAACGQRSRPEPRPGSLGPHVGGAPGGASAPYQTDVVGAEKHRHA